MYFIEQAYPAQAAQHQNHNGKQSQGIRILPWTLLLSVLILAFLMERVVRMSDKYESQLLETKEFEIKLLKADMEIEKMQRSKQDLVMKLQSAETRISTLNDEIQNLKLKLARNNNWQRGASGTN